MSVEQQLRAEAAPEQGTERRDGVIRYYELAKRAEWQTADMPWGQIPPVPEARGSAEKKARRNDVWRSVITQQYQADILAVKMAAQLLNLAPHHEAKMYYTTMVQDEARHVEAWLKLLEQVGGTAERDPYLDELARMFLDDLELLEEKVFLMQVFFERLIIPRFRLIARSSRGTILEDLCNRLTIDDGIHHGAGMAYERVLLESATKRTRQKLVKAANRMLPIFVEHSLWRPPARAWIGRAMHDRDVQRLREDLDDGVRLANSLGLDVSDVQLPY
jgi:1,2-phenylacetyl-CoA epoxidase catalytic subunit